MKVQFSCFNRKYFKINGFACLPILIHTIWCSNYLATYKYLVLYVLNKKPTNRTHICEPPIHNDTISLRDLLKHRWLTFGILCTSSKPSNKAVAGMVGVAAAVGRASCSCSSSSGHTSGGPDAFSSANILTYISVKSGIWFKLDPELRCYINMMW